MLQIVWKWLNRVLGVDRGGDRPTQSDRLLSETTQQTPAEHNDGVHLSHANSSDGDRGGASHLSNTQAQHSQAKHLADEAQLLSPPRKFPSSQKTKPTESRPLPQSSAQQSGNQHDGQTKLPAQLDADERATDIASNVARLEAIQENPPSGWAADATPELLKRYNAQESRIDALRQQLKELRPTAAIGEAWLRRGQLSSASRFFTSDQASQSHVPPSVSASNRAEPTSLQEQIIVQDNIIAGLEQDIQEARRLSTIGKARLNRWRNRTFSS
ncbi:MAG: hypothetical protein ACFE0I_11665 [Elainellaceae cyanobacterium]